MGPAALAQALRGGVVLHLVASCVVFLEGGCGGPTVVLDQLIGAGTSTSHEQHTRPSSASLLSLRACWTEASPAAVATRGWAAMPERDSCLVFDGSLLHTVLPPAAARQVGTRPT